MLSDGMPFAEPEVGLILLLPNQPSRWWCPTLLRCTALSEGCVPNQKLSSICSVTCQNFRWFQSLSGPHPKPSSALINSLQITVGSLNHGRSSTPSSLPPSRCHLKSSQFQLLSSFPWKPSWVGPFSCLVRH